MMKNKMTLLLVGCCLLLIGGCVTTKTGTKSLVFDAPRNVYTHEQSGFSFPPMIGRFDRGDDIRFYNEAGNDFSIPYNLITANEKAIGTIYIYPSLSDYSITPVPKFGQTPDWFIKERYDEAKNSIINRYRAKVLSESEYKLNRSLLNPSGKKGIFEWDSIGGETVFSHLYLFTHRGWLVKYRFTYPSKHNAVLTPEIEKFIKSYEWPSGDVAQEVAQPDTVDQQKAAIILSDRVLESKDILSPWMIYGAVRALWMNEKFVKENPGVDYRYTFDEELDARKLLACIWKELKEKDSTLSDAYLDALMNVNDAGFLSEYVWSFFRVAEWGTPSQTLKINEFEDWRKINLPDHRPLTLVTARRDK